LSFYFILESLREVDFNYQTGTGAHRSCSFLQDDKMYIVGGESDTTYRSQISIVSECELRLIGQLPNAFTGGACNTFVNQDGNQEALLCFGAEDRDGCIRYENI